MMTFIALFSHTVTVTESLLKDMVSHSLVVQIWSNKDKCSNRARSDKAKAFKLPADKSGNSHISEHLIRQSDLYVTKYFV